MIQNKTKSAEILRAEELLAQAKARLAEVKRKVSAKKLLTKEMQMRKII